MKFLILSRIPELYSSRRLVEEIHSANHAVSVENPDSSYAVLTSATGAEILIPRLGSYNYEPAMQTLRQFHLQNLGIRILNPPMAFHQARHKQTALQILKALPQPRIFATAERFPIVVKDCLAGKGEGVFLCRTREELSLCLEKLQDRELLFQEFIAESAGHDVRAFVIGDTVTAAIARKAQDPEKEFRSNLSLGGSASSVSLTSEETDLCVQATRLLGLDYAGVDFLRSNRGPLLLEVNPCPGFEGLEKATGINVAQKLITYACAQTSTHVGS